MMRRHGAAAQIVALAGLLAASACGKSSEPPDSSPQPPPSVDPGTRITGRERLGWDQELVAGTAADEYQFFVYVDGTRTALNSATCNPTAGSETAYVCTAPLPDLTDGRHTLEIVAARRALNGDVESAKSTTLVVTKSAAAASTSSTAPRDGTLHADTGRAVPRDLDIATVAEGLSQPSDLAVAPDGRLFVTEREGRVRVVAGGALVPEPALELDDVDARSGAGLSSIALHPGFARNHLVYVAYTARAGASSSYRVVRYREVGNRLAQPAVLLDEVPATAPGGARIRFGAASRLFVALSDLPGDYAQREDLGSWNGKLLRLADDGSTPDGNASGSPIFARGIGVAAGMTIDPVTGDVWISELRHDGGTDIGRASRRSPATAPSLVRMAIGGTAAPGGVAVSPLSTAGAGATELLVAAGTAIVRVQVPGRRPARMLNRVDVSGDPLSCLAVGANRAVYFCTDPARNGARTNEGSGTVARITMSR
jgi:Glucose / Sorbosone dehydrogenase